MDLGRLHDRAVSGGVELTGDAAPPAQSDGRVHKRARIAAAAAPPRSCCLETLRRADAASALATRPRGSAGSESRGARAPPLRPPDPPTRLRRLRVTGGVTARPRNRPGGGRCPCYHPFTLAGTAARGKP